MLLCLGFLEEVNSIQRKVSEPATPLTVLCGTGAGRSGIFILSDLLLHAADCGHVSVAAFYNCNCLIKVTNDLIFAFLETSVRLSSQ